MNLFDDGKITTIAQTGEAVEYPVKDDIPYLVEGSIMASLVMLLLFNIAFPAIKAAFASGANESKRVDSLITWQQQQYSTMLTRMDANSSLLIQISETARLTAEKLKELEQDMNIQRESVLALVRAVDKLTDKVNQSNRGNRNESNN